MATAWKTSPWCCGRLLTGQVGGQVLSFVRPWRSASIEDLAPARHHLLLGSIWHSCCRELRAVPLKKSRSMGPTCIKQQEWEFFFKKKLKVWPPPGKICRPPHLLLWSVNFAHRQLFKGAGSQQISRSEVFLKADCLDYKEESSSLFLARGHMLLFPIILY